MTKNITRCKNTTNSTTSTTHDLEKHDEALALALTLNQSYWLITEFEPVTMQDQKKGFVISSIREPCSHILSLWSFGSARQGSLYRRMRKRDPDWTESAYGKDAPLFDSEEDIARFRDVWLKDWRIYGLTARRFRDSYGYVNGNSPPDQVDCWIFVENFHQSLVSCLEQYESSGGYVNWDAPVLSKIVEQLRVERNNRRTLQEYKKNNALGFGETNPQHSHHAECSKYFDNATAHEMETGPEKFIYKMFHYDGCCKTSRSEPLGVEGVKRDLFVNISGAALEDEDSLQEQGSDYKLIAQILILAFVVLSLTVLKKRKIRA